VRKKLEKILRNFSKNPPLIPGGGFFCEPNRRQRRIGGKNE
jgi:hypothetical protein